ncbi:MAG: right-handed parallel beta-helix repeat-containing protein, partial [Marmoricola sp.]
MKRTSMLKRPLGIVTAMAAALAAVASNAGVAHAATARSVTLYASPTGSSTSCSSLRPCALSTAQSQARTYSRSGYNITVILAGGTYQLSAPLNFTWADNGYSQYRVTYQAASGQTPVLSGGRSLSGWKQYSAAKNIWVASAPGLAPTRQLYVNGRRATVASAPASTVFGALTPTASGYTTSLAGNLSAWSGTADQPDLHLAGAPFPWADSICGISSVADTTVTMANPCFQNLRTPMAGYTVPDSILDGPATVENNLALLNQPGQFYANTHDGLVYYIPRPGETMANATVIAPQLNTLVNVTDATNLSFSGITFGYTNWVPDPAQGFVDVQSNVYDTSSNTAWATMPSAVSVVTGTGVTITGDKFTHLGGIGLSVDAGGSGNTVTGNVVNDVSGTGISLSSPLAATESSDKVTDNYVHHVSVEYLGGVGIFAGSVAHTTIAHNEVWAVPGTGISLGWGWGSGSTMTDNHVDYNRVHDVNAASLFDGGAIYLNGAESGTAGNSTVVGNYISGDPQPYGDIYLEAGASNYNVSSNVVAHTSTNWLYLQTAQYGSPAVNNSISGNYTDTPAPTLCLLVSAVCSLAATIDPSNTLVDNVNGLLSWPTAATNVIAASGLESGYASIAGGAVDTNVAY